MTNEQKIEILRAEIDTLEKRLKWKKEQLEELEKEETREE